MRIAVNQVRVSVVSKERVLVTGADGFIGSHLVEELIDRGYPVRALVQYNSLGSYGWLEKNPSTAQMLEIVTGDIRDPFFCSQLMNGVDAVFHLAALIAIPYSYIAPSEYLATNVQGTLNICQAALANRIGKVIHTSTSEVYGTAKYVPINEEHPLQPQSPYSASKIAADAVAQSFHRSFDLPLVIARPFNTYGPRQSARAVIPTIISQIASGKRKIQVGDLTPTRDFNYVSDTCHGLIELLECDVELGSAYNIGSNYEISIRDTCELIKELMNADVEFVTESKRIRPAKSEVFRLYCDNSKIKKATSFSPKIDLRTGLMHTINWICDDENLSDFKTEIYNV